jgi:hypothetical protein
VASQLGMKMDCQLHCRVGPEPLMRFFSRRTESLFSDVLGDVLSLVGWFWKGTTRLIAFATGQFACAPSRAV